MQNTFSAGIPLWYGVLLNIAVALQPLVPYLNVHYYSVKRICLIERFVYGERIISNEIKKSIGKKAM